MLKDPVDNGTQSHMTPLTIGQMLAAGVARSASREIVHGPVRLTYSDFNRRVQRLASALSRLGIGPGTTVGVMDWDTHRYLECYFAIPMIGAILHTLNIRLAPEQVLYTINHAGDDFILFNGEFQPLVRQLWPRIENQPTLIRMDDAEHPKAEHPDPTSLDYESLLAQVAETEDGFVFPELDENSRATTFYTTGTTGLPKGVYYTHRQLVLHTLALSTALLGEGQGHISAQDVYMPLTPMFHVHAWGIPYLATMLGLKQVYPGRYHPAALLELIRTEDVTFSHCVPTVLQMILNAPQSRETNLSRWTVVIGGSSLSPSLARDAMARGIDIFGGYGMSETCPVLTLSQLTQEWLEADPEIQLKVRCMAGRTVPFVSIRIIDANSQVLPADGQQQGEVVARAPWLAEAYIGDPASSERLWYDGWLHTGDIGYITPDGYLKITDRLKDVIKSGGEWISSLEIEELLLSHPAVAEAAVFGVPDEKWGERPVGLVVFHPGTSASEVELLDILRMKASQGTLSRYGILSRINVVASLPKTSVGKLDKKALRSEYACHTVT